MPGWLLGAVKVTYGEEKTGENKEKPALSSALGAAAPSQGVPLGQAGLVPLGFKAQKADFFKKPENKKTSPICIYFSTNPGTILFIFFFLSIFSSFYERLIFSPTAAAVPKK